MQAFKLKLIAAASLSLLFLASFTIYQWKKPMAAIEGLWGADMYHTADNSIYHTMIRLNIKDKTMIFNSVTQDRMGENIADYKVTLEFLHRSGEGNIFRIIDSRSQYSPQHLTKPKIAGQNFYYQYLSPRFYQLDCNTLILDMNPGDGLGYTTKFSRVNSRAC